MQPRHVSHHRVGVDVALEVHIVALFDVVWVEIVPHLQRHHWLVWGTKEGKVTQNIQTHIRTADK